MKSQSIIFDVTLHTAASYLLFQRSQQRAGVDLLLWWSDKSSKVLIFNSAFGLIKKFLLNL